jgi:hypothetical protein
MTLFIVLKSKYVITKMVNSLNNMSYIIYTSKPRYDKTYQDITSHAWNNNI